jgi:hypothetical protein
MKYLYDHSKKLFDIPEGWGKTVKWFMRRRALGSGSAHTLFTEKRPFLGRLFQSCGVQ